MYATVRAIDAKRMPNVNGRASVRLGNGAVRSFIHCNAVFGETYLTQDARIRVHLAPKSMGRCNVARICLMKLLGVLHEFPFFYLVPYESYRIAFASSV